MDKDNTSEDSSPENPENDTEENPVGEPEAKAEESASQVVNKTPEEKKPEEKKPVDLSALEGFDFGTSWSETKSTKSGSHTSDRGFRGGERRPRQDVRDRKDRRSFKPGSFRKSERAEGSSSDRPSRRTDAPPRRKPLDRPEIPPKVIEISFYPEDTGFTAICKALRTSTITYELFDIARTILDKEERFYVIIHATPTPGESSETEPQLFISDGDGLPFLSEEEAKQHALTTSLEYFFTSETKEVDPPSGTFTSIRKCGVTGELLGPPNFHGLKRIIADHHASRLSNMPFARFESRIETVTDEEAVTAWMEKMKTQTSYTLKAEFGEPREFEYGETARAFVSANLSGKLVRPQTSVRLSGSQISKVLDPMIRANLDFAWERQKRFPLDTANLLRGRLRRQKFALYKKGSKGVSYVCAVKRKFREPGQVFSEPVQKLLEFLENNSGISVKDLAFKYLGFSKIEGEEGKPVELSPDQEKAIKAMTMDFQWLLREGYIAEFSDGSVVANPVAGPGQGFAEEKPKPEKKKATSETKDAMNPQDSEVPETDTTALGAEADTPLAESDAVDSRATDSTEEKPTETVAEASSTEADVEATLVPEETTGVVEDIAPEDEATSVAEPASEEAIVEEAAESETPDVVEDEALKETSVDPESVEPEVQEEDVDTEASDDSEDPESELKKSAQS